MASRVAVAIRQEVASQRISKAAAALAERFGVDRGELNPHHKNADIALAMRLEAVAGFLEALAAGLPAQEPDAAPKPRTRKTT